MNDQRSLRDRIRAWLGLDQVNPNRFPFLQKLERAEEDVALLRLAVALIIALAFMAHGLKGGPTPPAAAAVLTLAFGYSLAVVLLQAQSSFGRLPWSATTVVLDAVAISAWLYVTGGWTSAYFPLWYVGITAVGYRLNLPLTTGVSVVYVGAYAALCWATGGVGSWIEFGVRSLFIPITGALAGLTSESYVDSHHRHRGATRRLVDVIQRMDRRFVQVLEEAPDRIVITDAEGRVEYANGPLSELGFEAENGDAWARGMHENAIRSALETGDRVEYVTGCQRFWCRLSPIQEDEDPVGTVIVVRRAPEGLSLDEALPRGERTS